MICLVTDDSIPVILGNAIQIQQAILSELYGSALGRHLGQQKINVLVEKWFYWL